MFETLFDGSTVNVFIAYAAGFVTFFASCLLPLVPTYLAYLSGVSLSVDQAGEDGELRQRKWVAFRTAAFFVLGFVITFVILGAMVNQFAPVVARYRALAFRLGGVFFMVMGLYLTGVLKHDWLAREFRLSARHAFQKQRQLHAFLTGVAFGFGWTPCIGPILALIMVWSANQATQLQGLTLLLAYGIGLGTPFLLVAAVFDKLLPILKKSAKLVKYVTIFSGLIVFLAGFLMFFGQFQALSYYLLRIFNLRKFSV